MVLNLMAVRVRGAEFLSVLQKEYGLQPETPERFVIVSESSEFVEDTELRDWGAVEYSQRFGEAIFVWYYDGGAGELCGSILYEHAVEGRIVRALGYSPNLWGDELPDPERLLWRRVEGVPESWEKTAFPFAEAELNEALAEAESYGSPSADDVRRAWALGTFSEGAYFPGNAQDRLLGAVRRHFNF